MLKTIILSSIILISIQAFAQSDSSKTDKPGNFIWLQTGGGVGNSQINGGAALNFTYKNFLWSLALEEFKEEFVIFGPPSDVLSTYGVKIGKLYNEGYLYYTLQAGLHMAKSREPIRIGSSSGLFSHGKYIYKEKTIPDLSLEISAGLRILEISTLNLALGTHLNTELPQFYARLSLGFGKLF